jgi:hypothetical protein
MSTSRASVFCTSVIDGRSPTVSLRHAAMSSTVIASTVACCDAPAATTAAPLSSDTCHGTATPSRAAAARVDRPRRPV